MTGSGSDLSAQLKTILEQLSPHVELHRRQTANCPEESSGGKLGINSYNFLTFILCK